jgi:hypothetical protein
MRLALQLEVNVDTSLLNIITRAGGASLRELQARTTTDIRYIASQLASLLYNDMIVLRPRKEGITQFQERVEVPKSQEELVRRLEEILRQGSEAENVAAVPTTRALR